MSECPGYKSCKFSNAFSLRHSPCYNHFDLNEKKIEDNKKNIQVNSNDSLLSYFLLYKIPSITHSGFALNKIGFFDIKFLDLRPDRLHEALTISYFIIINVEQRNFSQSLSPNIVNN